MTHQATIAAALREFCGCTEPAANDYAATILDRLNLPDWRDRPTGPGLWVAEPRPTASRRKREVGPIEERHLCDSADDFKFFRWYGPLPLDTEPPNGT